MIIKSNGTILDINKSICLKNNQKHQYGDQVISIFIEPPSVEALRERLTKRGTDSTEAINKRVAKASEEIAQKIHFDHIVMNDDLDRAIDEVLGLVTRFLEKS